MFKILETDRLILRQFTTEDAPFMLRILNEPSWLEFIGDRNVHTLEEAELYLVNGSLKSYGEHGFGFYMVMLKSNSICIGITGLAKRPYLKVPDIGFAFLPEYTGMGYALEASKAMLHYALETLGIREIEAFTSKDNVKSIQLLRKLGFHFEKIIVPESQELFLFSTSLDAETKQEIDELTAAFYSVFINTEGHKPDLPLLYHLCIANTTIIKNLTGQAEIYSLPDFIVPREKILSDGTLIDFSEHEEYSDTDIFGHIAQRWSHYKKMGVLNGVPFETCGTKSFQFIKTSGGWKISSVIWDDEKLL
jgi:RimJ/RimL family protein N-acetyltransferase